MTTENKYPVYLVLYDFCLDRILNIKCTHTEIVVHNQSFGYDGEDGITVSPICNLEGEWSYKVKKVIQLGFTKKSERQVKRIIRELDQTWTIADYCLFSNNCRHFSKCFVLNLEVTEPEEGLRVLGSLINLSEKIGQVVAMICRFLLSTMFMSPKRYIACIFSFIEWASGTTTIDVNETTKDKVLIFMMILLLCYGLWKMVKTRNNRVNADLESLAQSFNRMTIN